MFSALPKQQEYEHVYSKDPALDTDSEAYNHRAYCDTGDRAHIPTKPGATPVMFRFRRLRHSDRDAIGGLGDGTGLSEARAMLSIALVAVDPFVIDGQERNLARAWDAKREVYRVGADDIEIIRAIDGQALYMELLQRIQKEELGDPSS